MQLQQLCVYVAIQALRGYTRILQLSRKFAWMLYGDDNRLLRHMKRDIGRERLSELLLSVQEKADVVILK